MCHSLGNRMNQDVQSDVSDAETISFLSECILGSSYCKLSHCDRHFKIACGELPKQMSNFPLKFLQGFKKCM